MHDLEIPSSITLKKFRIYSSEKNMNVFLYYTGLADEDAEFTMSHPLEGYIQANEFIDVLKQMNKVNPFYRVR